MCTNFCVYLEIQRFKTNSFLCYCVSITLDSESYDRRRTNEATRMLPELGVHFDASVLGVRVRTEATFPRHL